MKAFGDGRPVKEKRGVKFDRLLVILDTLMNEGGRTAGELADEFRVSKKTIWRDIDVLSICFPVLENPHPEDPRKTVYSIDESKIVRGQLDVEEQLALAIARRMPTPFGAAFGNTLAKVEEKALRAAPPTSDVRLLDAFVFNPTGDTLAVTLRAKLLKLAEACVKGRCMRITYKRLFKVTESKRTIEPICLFCSTDGFWYVNAFCQMENGWRTFSVDQILEYELLQEVAANKLAIDKACDIAAGFGAFHGGKEEKVVVRFSPLIRPYIERRKWHGSQTTEDVDDAVFGKGSLELQLRTTGLEGVKHWLKLWIPDFRVIEPASLREELCEEMEKQAKYLKESCIER